VDKDGNVDKDTPIIWDFDQITDITTLPIDETTLRITGGRFTTTANQAESKYTYYNRNIAIRRSNVVVDGLEHRVIGEGDHGAPYGGFINIGDCANVTVRNTVLTGHKTYSTIGSAGQPVSMGSYDIQVNRALNVSLSIAARRMTSTTASIGGSWHPTTARTFCTTTVSCRASTRIWGLPMPPSATRPLDTWASMPSALGF
jgi:hypothetical protein